MYLFGKPACKIKIRSAGLAPDEISVGCVGQSSGQGLVKSLAGAVETFHGAFSGEELLITWIMIRRHEIGGFGIGPGEQYSGHTQDVGSETCGD